MEVNYCNSSGSGGNVQIPKRLSVIKSTQSCCLDKDASIKYQDKLESDIQLTHQNYIKIEQENSYLNLKIYDLDNRVNDQNYQYACLQYELEQINREKRVLNSKLNDSGIVANISEQYENQVIQPITKIESEQVSKSKVLVEKPIFHYADLKKIPEIVCICGVHFKTHQNLKEHIKYYSNNAKFSCGICGIQKHGMNLLRHHMKVTHDVTNFPSVKGCRKCGKLFGKLEELHAHRRQEHGRKSREENWKTSSQNILYQAIQTSK